MRYEKPELSPLGSAAELVQGTAKNKGNNDSAQLPTAAAYEAEE